MNQRIDGVKLVEVIRVEYAAGDGTPGDPARFQVAFYAKTGEKLADTRDVTEAIRTRDGFFREMGDAKKEADRLRAALVASEAQAYEAHLHLEKARRDISYLKNAVDRAKKRGER